MVRAETSSLTEGKILNSLLRLALPIAGGQVMNMAYNITDMFWLGRVSGDAVAASGVAGLFIWLSVGLMLIGRVGAEIGVSQARGRGDIDSAYSYSRAALYISAALGLLYASFIFIFRVQLIGFFNFQEAHVAADAVSYLAIIALGIPVMYISNSIDGSFVASGDSRTPFMIGSGGLILNMILTPIFVLGLGMGVIGAAVTSIIAQYIAFFVRLVAVKKFRSRPFAEYRFFAPIDLSAAWHILKLTLPISLEQTLFPLLTMITTRFEISFGAFAVAMSRVGTQIESLSWLVGAGFGAALTAFVGQNYGAGKMDRVSQSVKYATVILGIWGVIVTAILAFGSSIIFTVFLPEYAADPEMRNLFITYMRILAACQIFANLESVAANAFRGIGKTVPPSVIGIASNIIRVPLAYFLSTTALGLIGIWVAISLTAGFRGLAVFAWYLKTNYKKDGGIL